MRLANQQILNVVARDLNAVGLFERDCVGLMRSLLENGSEAEKLARGWLIDDNLLLVFIDGSDSDFP